jgi:hypothetical protein
MSVGYAWMQMSTIKGSKKLDPPIYYSSSRNENDSLLLSKTRRGHVIRSFFMSTPFFNHTTTSIYRHLVTAISRDSV